MILGGGFAGVECARQLESFFKNNSEVSNDTYYSIGGGFVVREQLYHAKEI